MKICPKCHNEHSKNGTYCTRKCANSKTWTEEDKLKKSLSALNSSKVKLANQQPRKTKTRNEDNWHNVNCTVCDTEFNKLKTDLRKTCSSICSKKIKGGLRKNSGIGKSGWYKGFWLNSTYEIAFVHYHLKKNIPIKRCESVFEYLDPKINKQRKYYPDFIVNNKIYEIKGYKDYLTEIKINTCNATLLCKDDLKEVFKFVEEDTGLTIKELYKLYE